MDIGIPYVFYSYFIHLYYPCSVHEVLQNLKNEMELERVPDECIKGVFRGILHECVSTHQSYEVMNDILTSASHFIPSSLQQYNNLNEQLEIIPSQKPNATQSIWNERSKRLIFQYFQINRYTFSSFQISSLLALFRKAAEERV
jgi:hypothetical protein